MIFNINSTRGHTGSLLVLYYIDPTQTKFFINETSSLMHQVSVDTVIPCIRGEVQENVIRFGQNH